jgi:mRNA-degrading endonuclease toxin of MazEF toxin-antitoxin module
VVPLSPVKGKAPERLVQPILTANESGLPKDSCVLCDQVRTVDQERIGRTVRVLDKRIIQRIDGGLILHLQQEGYFQEQAFS